MPKGGRRQGAGRPRKPTKLKILQGTFRPDRHGDEVAAGAGDAAWPDPPAHLKLSKREKELWTCLGEHVGQWTVKSDWPAVWGCVRLMVQILDNHARQKRVNDASLVGPLIDQEVKLFDKLRQYLAVMGLTPADRARMRIADPTEDEPGSLGRLRRRVQGR